MERTSIEITEELRALLDEVRVMARAKLPRGLRSYQALILWLAEQHARLLLASIRDAQKRKK